MALPIILPCPCGGIPRADCRQSQEDVVDSWVQCSACGRVGGEIESSYSEKESSIILWNHEVGSHKTEDAMQCEECKPLLSSAWIFGPSDNE